MFAIMNTMYMNNYEHTTYDNESGLQEHLLVMGVPAFPHLARHSPYPLFNFNHQTDTSVKKFAGNETYPYALHILDRKSVV